MYQSTMGLSGMPFGSPFWMLRGRLFRSWVNPKVSRCLPQKIKNLICPFCRPQRMVPYLLAIRSQQCMWLDFWERTKECSGSQEDSSTLSDLRQGPAILIGAFNNDWNLLLMRQLRFTLALDMEQHLIYIKDAQNPTARIWSWSTNRPMDHRRGPGSPILTDYALISRSWNSETGHAIISIGGLYTYGTQAAGEFITDPQLMQEIARNPAFNDLHKTIQIVLETTVTDETQERLKF